MIDIIYVHRKIFFEFAEMFKNVTMEFLKFLDTLTKPFFPCTYQFSYNLWYNQKIIILYKRIFKKN